MAKSFITLAHGGKLTCRNNSPWYLHLENVGTVVNYRGIYITLTPDLLEHSL
jgi:hypothetical protein